MKVIASWVLTFIFLPFLVAGICWLLGRESFKYGVELAEEMCNWIYS